MPDQPFVSEIFMGGMNFAPRGYASCAGQTLPISQNTALFSLLGTTFGGDGRTTFQLPDLRGRVPMGMGQGQGLSLRDLGEVGGEENHTLLLNEMPNHTHLLMAADADGNTNNPAGNYLSKTGAIDKEFKTVTGGESYTNMHAQAIGINGSTQPHNNMQPYLVLNFYIALQGVFPARP